MNTESGSPVNTEPQAKVAHASPLEIVLQWLAYAFWGLLAMSLMWLVVIVLNLAIRGVVFDEVTPYALAAVLVLLPVAYVTDMFYRKQEPAKKAGMAAVVMVIHAVLFALLAIGTLIGAVFTAVSLLVSVEPDVSMSVVVLISLLIAALLYILLFVRTITPQRPKRLSFIVSLILLVASLGLFVWGVTGPAVQSVVRKNDRRIDNNIEEIQRAVSTYAKTENALPESLADVKQSLSPGARSVVDDKLVTYRVDDPSVMFSISAGGQKEKLDNEKSIKLPERELRYQLCATYKSISVNDRETYYGGDDSNVNKDGYSLYLSTTGHDKGEVCYKLRVYSALTVKPYYDNR